MSKNKLIFEGFRWYITSEYSKVLCVCLFVFVCFFVCVLVRFAKSGEFLNASASALQNSGEYSEVLFVCVFVFVYLFVCVFVRFAKKW